MEGAVRRGHHHRAVHGLRGLRRHLSARRHRVRARGGQVHPVPPRGRARSRQLHPRREGLHHVHPRRARGSGRGSRRPTCTCSVGCASPTRWAASGGSCCSRGRPTTTEHEKGQDGGFVSAMLIWLLEHDYIEAAMVSGVEPDDAWKAKPVLVAQQGGGARHRRQPLHVLRQPAGAARGARSRASTGSRWSGMGCQTSSPPIMWDRKAGKVSQAVPVQHRPAVLQDVRRRDLPRAVRGQVRPEEAGHGEDEHQGRLPDLDEGRLVPRDRPEGVPPVDPCRAARAAPTSRPSTPTSPPAASARTTTGR